MGVPHPVYVFFWGKKGVTDLGGTPLPPFTDISPKKILQKGLKIVFFAQKSPDFGHKNRLWIFLPPYTDFPPKIFLQKGLKIVFFAQKTPDFGPKNRLRIWGVPPSPPLRIFFQRKGGYGFGGYPPPLYGQNPQSSI